MNDIERSPESSSRRLERLRRFATILDSAIALPGGLRVGLDSILGLVPFVGDAIGALLSLYILTESARAGVSTAVLFRMMGNIAVEVIIGSIPVVGDLFDVVWKANTRNVDLLERNLETLDDSASVQFNARKKIGRAAVWLLSLFTVGVVLVLAISFKALAALLAIFSA